MDITDPASIQQVRGTATFLWFCDTYFVSQGCRHTSGNGQGKKLFELAVVSAMSLMKNESVLKTYQSEWTSGKEGCKGGKKYCIYLVGKVFI